MNPTLPRFSKAFVFIIAALGFLIFSIWFGVNSDKDNVPSLLNQLIPAGHCACQTSTIFKCDHVQSLGLDIGSHTPRDLRNRSLNETQCHSLFPGSLFEDVIRAHEFWSQSGVQRADLDQILMKNGMARAEIYHGNLYVKEVYAKGEDHRRKIMGILSSIYFAISSDTLIPDTEFIFSIEDKLSDVAELHHQYPLWVLARKASEESVWLMPDFGFWAWENNNFDGSIGPYDQVVENVRQKEPAWNDKINQLVWRGKLSFAPKLRRTLLEVARNQKWGDHQAALVF